jgi:hypothetical protein
MKVLLILNSIKYKKEEFKCKIMYYTCYSWNIKWMCEVCALFGKGNFRL